MHLTVHYMATAIKIFHHDINIHKTFSCLMFKIFNTPIHSIASAENTFYVLIHYVQTNVNYLPLKYPQNQVQQSMGGSHADPNTFITPF